jgi:hypothetical protein
MFSFVFNDSCEEKNKLNMLSQPHRGDFNIEPCIACGEKPISHTETGAEKRCNNKKQPPTLAVL